MIKHWNSKVMVSTSNDGMQQYKTLHVNPL